MERLHDSCYQLSMSEKILHVTPQRSTVMVMCRKPHASQPNSVLDIISLYKKLWL